MRKIRLWIIALQVLFFSPAIFAEGYIQMSPLNIVLTYEDIFFGGREAEIEGYISHDSGLSVTGGYLWDLGDRIKLGPEGTLGFQFYTDVAATKIYNKLITTGNIEYDVAARFNLIFSEKSRFSASFGLKNRKNLKSQGGYKIVQDVFGICGSAGYIYSFGKRFYVTPEMIFSVPLVISVKDYTPAKVYGNGIGRIKGVSAGLTVSAGFRF